MLTRTTSFAVPQARSGVNFAGHQPKDVQIQDPSKTDVTVTQDSFFSRKILKNLRKPFSLTWLRQLISAHLSKKPEASAVEVEKSLLQKRMDAILAGEAHIDDAPKHGMPILHDAATMGELDMVRQALANDAEIDQLDGQKRTALHWAALNGEEEVVRELLDAGAKVNTRDHFGNSPLESARSLAHGGVVDLLKGHGAIENYPLFYL